jgi:anti-sigma B factor antagonist
VVATVTQPSLCEEDNIDQFGVELNQMIETSGNPWLVLDLHRVTLITSSAVGKLIGLHRNLHRRDGRLALCGVVGMIRSVFQTAKLLDYFHVTTTVDEAVELLVRERANQGNTSIEKLA